MISIQQQEGDSAAYLLTVSDVVNGIAKHYSPPRLVLVRINNWFGPRWLQFSGKVPGAFGIRKSQVTIPPFVPNRVDSEQHFRRLSISGDYALTPSTVPIHKDIPSSDDLQRFVDTHYPHTAFIWYSGNSLDNAKGSVMASIPSTDNLWCWYTELGPEADWEPISLIGISLVEFRQLTKEHRLENA